MLGCVSVLSNIHTAVPRHTDTQADRQTGRQTDTQTDRQTHRHTGRQTGRQTSDSRTKVIDIDIVCQRFKSRDDALALTNICGWLHHQMVKELMMLADDGSLRWKLRSLKLKWIPGNKVSSYFIMFKDAAHPYVADSLRENYGAIHLNIKSYCRSGLFSHCPIIPCQRNYCSCTA